MYIRIISCQNVAEELETHECKKELNYRIGGNILWLSECENQYPRKLLSKSPTRNEQQNITTKDETGPKIVSE